MNKASRVFLVLLRIAVGWHFLYEGVFKIQSDSAPDRYLTSRYFLQASTARLRDALPGLAPEAAQARIEQWSEDIIKYFKGQDNALGDDQRARLAALRDSLKLAGGAAANLDWMVVHEEVLKIAAAPASPRFSSLEYLKASAGPLRGVFRALAPDVEGLERLTARSAQERLEQRYRDIVDHYRRRGFPLSSEQQARLGLARDGLKQSLAATFDDPGFQARLGDYRGQVRAAREAWSRTDAPYSKERLEAYRTRLDTLGDELLAFVNEPLAELTLQAQALASADQMRAGTPPRPREQTWLIDWMVKWGLTGIGLCLLLGLFSKAAALAGAAQLAMFYFASPPLPGLPAAGMGGHFLYVDRNLIELLAALVLFSTDTGRWAGLDALWPMVKRMRRRVGLLKQGTDLPVPQPSLTSVEQAAGVDRPVCPQFQQPQ